MSNSSTGDVEDELYDAAEFNAGPTSLPPYVVRVPSMVTLDQEGIRAALAGQEQLDDRVVGGVPVRLLSIPANGRRSASYVSSRAAPAQPLRWPASARLWTS